MTRLYATTKGGGKAFRNAADVAAHFGGPHTVRCRAIRQSDEVYCPDCALRWGLGEDRPECPKGK